MLYMPDQPFHDDVNDTKEPSSAIDELAAAQYVQSDPVRPTNILCIRCGYDLTGTALGGVCPECGTAVEQSLPLLTSNSPSNRLAPNTVACLVLGILSLTVCGLLGPVAIGLYYSVESNCRHGKYSRSSMAMAKAGLICGIISTVLLVLGILFSVVGSL